MSDNEGGNDPFVERIAEPLRELEQADPTFEARVMSAVHLAKRPEALRDDPHRSWWTRRSWRVSPLGALAMAAGIAGLAIVGTKALDTLGPTGNGVNVMGAAARVDTVHLVRFVFLDSTASRVSLVGTFNQWQKDATVLTAAGGGAWTVDVRLPTGRHEYAFVVTDRRGERWVADPLSPTVRDEYDTPSSVIAIRNPGA